MFQRNALILAFVACISRGITGDSDRERKVYTDCSQNFLDSSLKDFTCSGQANQYEACVVKGLSLQEMSPENRAHIDKVKQVLCNGNKLSAIGSLKLGDAFKIYLVANPIEFLQRYNGFLEE